MLETPHVVVAAAIAYKIGDPLLALPLSLASHFILEKVPHWNPHINSELKKFGRVTTKSTRFIIVDVVLALTAGFYIASLALPDTGNAITIILACFFGVLPDLLEAPYFYLKSKNKLLQKLVAFQKSIQEDTGLIPGLLTQLGVIIAAFWWIFN